jgi:hypothetical protein
MWKEGAHRKAQSYVLLTDPLTRHKEWSVQEVLKRRTSTFRKIITG